jgi:phosphosulfolactate synthase
MKPRTDGYTMVLDKGLGRYAVTDLMETAADYIDFLKLSFGTSAFYDEKTVREKIEIATSAGVDVYPGGTFLEVTVWQGRFEAYLQRAKELGFTGIEVSDGTIEIADEVRADCLKRALDAGFKVLSEVGKKSPDEKIATTEMHHLKSGAVDESEVDQIVAGVADPEKLMWEAPIKNQQQYMILRFGTNVNLGNIPTTDLMALEALRQGLRGDTLKRAYLQDI